MKQTNNSKKTNVIGVQRNLLPTMKTAPTSQQVHTSKASSSSTDLQSWWKELRFSERVLLPLRLFLGITFLYAGIQKLTDPQFFNPSATGFIGKRSWPLRIDRPSTMFYCMLRYLMLYSLARLLL